MKGKTLLAGFAILTLLLGFSSGNFVNLVYAEEDGDRIQDDREKDEYRDEQTDREEKYREEQQEKLEKYRAEEQEKLEKYREAQQERQDKYREEIQEKLEKYREEHKEKQDKYREEHKEKHEKYRDELRTHKHEIKAKYHDMKKDFREQYHDLKEQLKNDLRDLKHARLAAAESLDSNLPEFSEEDILAFEDKRKQLQDLKREFREKIRDIKTQARQEIDTLKQDYVKHEKDRRLKIQDKLDELRTQFKDRIKEHRADIVTDRVTDFQTDEPRHVIICHYPPGNHDKAHDIRVSVNALDAHFRHGDAPGGCDFAPGDGTDEGTNDEEEKEDILDEIERKVRAETLGEQSEVKIELEFETKTIDSESIVNEIIENFALSADQADQLLVIEQEDDEELEEKFEVKVEIKNNGFSEVEVKLRFVLDTTERDAIINAIVEQTQLTAIQIEESLENDFGEEIDPSQNAMTDEETNDEGTTDETIDDGITGTEDNNAQ